MNAMHLKRGLLRLWVVSAALYAALTFYVSFESIGDEFRRASSPLNGASSIVPISCENARGKLGTDYEEKEQLCWYSLANYKSLYPESKGTEDNKLSTKLYAEAGLNIFSQYDPLPSSARPWTVLFRAIKNALLIPLAVLIGGASLVWAFSGFKAK